MLYRKFQKLLDTSENEQYTVIGTPHDHVVLGKKTEIYLLRSSQNVSVVVNRELVESERFELLPD